MTVGSLYSKSMVRVGKGVSSFNSTHPTPMTQLHREEGIKTPSKSLMTTPEILA